MASSCVLPQGAATHRAVLRGVVSHSAVLDGRRHDFSTTNRGPMPVHREDMRSTAYVTTPDQAAGLRFFHSDSSAYTLY